MKRQGTKLAAAVVAAGLLAPEVSLAQQEDPNVNVTVQDRQRRDFDPLGIRTGSFLIFPSISLQATYDDNIDAEPNNEEDDFGFLVSPLVRAQSQWSRHSLSADVGGEVARFPDKSDNDYEDVSAGLGGRLDVTRDDFFTGALRASREHEGRDSADDTGEEEITNVFGLSTRLGYRQTFNRVFVSPTFSAQRLDFNNDEASVDDRDRNRFEGGLRAGYALSPRFDIFAQGSYNIIRYDETPDDDGVDRDSEGFNVGVGADIDITNIIFGEVSFGFRSQEYDDDDLDTSEGLGASGLVTWNITTLTSLIFEISADVIPTTVSFEGETASSSLRQEGSVEVQHELLRNVILNGRVRFTRDDYDGTDRVDNTFRAGAGVQYLLNRRLAVDGRYDFAVRESDADNEEFTRNVFLVGLTARL